MVFEKVSVGRVARGACERMFPSNLSMGVLVATVLLLI